MQRSLSLAALAAAAASLVACATEPTSDAPPAMTALDASAAPLQAWFEAHVERPRAVMLLSPT